MQLWKYLISCDPDLLQNITLPISAKLLYLGRQKKRIGLWFEVDQKETLKVIRYFRVFETRHTVENGQHLGTVIIDSSVLHVCEM